ncbi:MAG: Coenzyme F420 hydrogenase/dehydrogenase, beta subunit C-terminal domain [Methanoregulaceae archaeon]
MAEKSYLDLKKEVWDKGTCSGCGACVAVCPADALFFVEGESGQSPKNNGYCKQAVDGVRCGACFDVCPRVVPQTHEALGKYREILAGKAAFEIPRKQSGGAVTAILMHALDAGLVDAVVTVAEDRWSMKPKAALITKSEALIHEAGSRYNWWVPLLASLKTAVIDRKYNRIAVVGVPCVVQAIHRMRTSENDLVQPFGKSIRLVIGLFCTETFDYRLLVEGKLVKDLKIEPWQIRKLDVRGKLDIQLAEGGTKTIALKELETCVRGGCHYCTDLTALNSDISAGSVGSPENMTTLIVRTETGQGFVRSAAAAGKLTTQPGIDLAAIEKLAKMKIGKAKPIA